MPRISSWVHCCTVTVALWKLTKCRWATPWMHRLRKEAGTVAHTYERDAEAGRWESVRPAWARQWVRGQPGLDSELEASLGCVMEPSLKNRKRVEWRLSHLQENNWEMPSVSGNRTALHSGRGKLVMSDGRWCIKKQIQCCLRLLLLFERRFLLSPVWDQDDDDPDCTYRRLRDSVVPWYAVMGYMCVGEQPLDNRKAGTKRFEVEG